MLMREYGSEVEMTTEYGYSTTCDPWWRGDACESSLIGLAKLAVRESAIGTGGHPSLDETNGLLMVLAGSLIADLLGQLGALFRQVQISRDKTELPAWITQEKWSTDMGGS